MRKWRSARAATCGACVTASTCTRAAKPGEPQADRIGDRAADAGVDLVEHQRRRRAAVGQHHLQRQQETRQLAARGDLHQRTRPRAGIGLHPELDPVDAVRSGAAGVARRSRWRIRALELERREFRIHRLVERVGGLARAPRDSVRRRRAIARVGLAPRLLRALRAARRRHRSARDRRRISSRSAASSSTGTLYLRAAARSANSRSSIRSSSRGSKSATRSACSRWPRASSSAVERRVERLHRRLEQARRLRARRSSRRIAAGKRRHAAMRCRRRASCASRRSSAIFSACIMAVRRSASAVSSPASGASLPQFVDAHGAASRPRAARARPRRDGCRPRPPPRAAPSQSAATPPPRPRARQRHRAARRCVAASTSARSSCWPWISTSAAPSALQRLHADRLIVDEGAGAAVGELHAAQDQLVVGVDVVLAPAARGPDACADSRTRRSPGPARRPGAPARRRRARRAPARRHRAGSICRRRSRRSAPTSPAAKSMSSRSIRTMSRIESRESMAPVLSAVMPGREPGNPTPADRASSMTR